MSQLERDAQIDQNTKPGFHGVENLMSIMSVGNRFDFTRQVGIWFLKERRSRCATNVRLAQLFWNAYPRRQLDHKCHAFPQSFPVRGDRAAMHL